MRSVDDRLPPNQDDIGDLRLYATDTEGWDAHIKRGGEKEYCFYQNPGEAHFHLLLAGEIHLQRGSEKICLTCARRHGLITPDRLHWRKGG
jgi:hypothetical protein